MSDAPTMKAIVMKGPGGPEVLEYRDVPLPEPRGDQVRVRVRACGVNRADLMQRLGRYPAPAGVPADIPGLEFAGVVDAIGSGATPADGCRLGDRVMGILGGGGYAEYVLTHPRTLIPIPCNMDDVEAAAIPEAFLTAFDALEEQARLRSGERVLIHAVGSGVGTAAVQLASAMGCWSLGSSRSAAKLVAAAGLGLNVAINTKESQGNFADLVRSRTGGEGVDAIIDFLGGSALEENLNALAPRGRLVLVGLLAGTTGTLDLSAMLRKRLTLQGTVLRSRPVEEKIALSRKFAVRIVPWLKREVVRPVVDQVLPLREAAQAHERMAANQGFGKIVLRTVD